MAGVFEDVLRDRSVHRNHRTCLSGKACGSVSTAIQRLLPPAPDSHRARRRPEEVSVRDSRSSASRIDPGFGGNGHHHPVRDVRKTIAPAETGGSPFATVADLVVKLS